MIGHGSPASYGSALARAAIAVCAWLFGFSQVRGQTPGEAPPLREPVQLRITWGRGEASRWIGRIGIDSGSISNLKVLGGEADAAASFWLEEGRLRVSTPSPHKLDRLEIAAEASAGAKLTVE